MFKHRSYLPVSQWLCRPSSYPIVLHNRQYVTTEMLKRDVICFYQQIIDHPAKQCALFFKDAYYFLVAMLASLHAGKVPVLLGCHNSQLLNAYKYDYDTLFTDDANLASVSTNWFLPDLLENVGHMTNVCLPEICADNKLVLYTSGSSGEPTRVEKRVALMDTESQWLAQLWADQFQARLIRGSVNHNHLYGLTFRIWLSLSMGYIFDTAIVEFSEQIDAEEPYIFITSPAFLQFLDHKLTPPPWTFIVSAGGPLSPILAKETFQWGKVAVHEIYGSSETGVIAYRNCIQGSLYWQSFPEVTLTLTNEDRCVLHSPLLGDASDFYLEDRLAFVANGQFSLLERMDKIIKIGEKRLSVNFIENKLREFSNIADVAVVPIQRNARIYLGAVVVLTDAEEGISSQNIAIWRKQLRQFVDPVAIPRFWRAVATIPLNSQGKRIWRVLQDLFDVAD